MAEMLRDHRFCLGLANKLNTEILALNLVTSLGIHTIKNPAYRRHQLSRPMRIVGPIQFWRGCVIYPSAPKSGLGPRENGDSVDAKVGTRSTLKKILTRFTSEHIPVFRALLKIEI